MVNDKFPIGFIKCNKCGKPALWMCERVEYNPIEGDTDRVQMHIEYDLVNYKVTNYDPDTLGYYLCDSCGCEVEDNNFESAYIAFIDKPKQKDIQ